MEPKRKRSSFGLYEIALLKESPYTHEVRARQISFTAEFKRIFWARHQAGEYIPAIFESLGYDPETLGTGRMYSLASNLRKCMEEGREFTSSYTNRAKNREKAEQKPAPDTSSMQHELTYLRQQVEFLKNYRAERRNAAEALMMDKPDKKFELIREIVSKEDNVLSIAELCRIAGVSRSGYYRWVNAEDVRRAREKRDQEDFSLILQAYQFRGYAKEIRGIYMRLLHLPEPVVMNVKKIQRPMRKYGLYCPIRQANPYRRMAKAIRTSAVVDNLLNREFEQHGPRKVLLTDITYILYHGVFCCLSTILDAFAKQVLAYVLSPSLELDFVLEAVYILIRKHGVSLDAQTLVHSGQGRHYTSLRFIRILKDSSLRQSMSRRGNCWDNAPQESFFGHMKDEIDLSGCESFDQVKAVVDDWIDYYNNDRYQWQLAKLSPNEFYRYLVSGIYPLLGKPSFDARLDPI